MKLCIREANSVGVIGKKHDILNSLMLLSEDNLESIMTPRLRNFILGGLTVTSSGLRGVYELASRLREKRINIVLFAFSFFFHKGANERESFHRFFAERWLYR